MSVLTQPPSDFSPDLLHHVRAALRTTGRLLPATDEEVAKSLNAIEARSTESQPDLSDPYELFDTGNSGASASTRSEAQKAPRPSSSLQDEIDRSLALARNGEEIPPEIREKMNEDRKDQEEDSADDQPDEEPSDEEENDESNE